VPFVIGVISGFSQILDDDPGFSYPTSSLTELLTVGAPMYTSAAILLGARAILLGLTAIVEQNATDE